MGRKGFSLIELMVVVAIIAILSFIAIPGYQTYKARARRGEGINLLMMYYASAQTARGEFGVYPGNFVETGFQPQGILNYRLRANDNAAFQAGTRIFDSSCFATWSDCGCLGGGSVPCPNFKTWEELAPLGAIGVRLGPVGGTVACGTLAPLSVTDNAFSIRVAGVINVRAQNSDVVGLDHMKNIVVCEDGTK